MSKKPTIRLKIKIGDVEHEMGPDEVKALRDALNEIYPDPLRTVRHEYVPVSPWRDRWTYGPVYRDGVVGAVAQNSPSNGALDLACLQLKEALDK